MLMMIITRNQYQSKVLSKKIINIMKAEAIKTKKLSVKQYLYKIMPYLSDLINDNKAIENKSNEWKIQTNIHVNFVSSNDNGEDRTIFQWSDKEEISRLGNETGDITKRLINSFLNNYLKEEIILRNESNFVFESVDLLSYHIHKQV